jgi:formate dehydrogenase beta subunit
MSAVSFSSWNGKIVDNRKGSAKPADFKIPERLNGHKVRALMGWNGLVVMDPKTDIPSLTFHYLKAIRKISCGECSVCMIGIDRLLDLFRGMNEGKGSRQTLEEIETIVKGVAENSKCNFGSASLLPVLDAIKAYRDDFIGLAEGRRRIAEKEFPATVTAPCTDACPAGVDVPGYIELIRNNRFREAVELVRERCILPGVIGRACPAPCQEACVRTEIDEALAIRLLKRAAADYDLQEGAAGLGVPGGEKTTEKVAVIGAGPAGLATAYHLRTMGYPVTIFEALPYAGGMTAAGIPDYRLPKDILNHEIDLIKRMGVEIKLNTPINKMAFADLQKKGFQAVFLAVGAQKGTRIGCRGEDEGYDGYIDGVEFLRNLTLGGKVEPRGKVVVIGGGNVAIDCARTCARLGFGQVEILYRRTRAEMPAHAEEIEGALQEGIRISYLVAPVSVVTKGGKVTGVECIKMKLGEPDESGRRRPVPVKGSEFTVKTDMVIPATGQKADLSFVEELDITDWGTVKVDPATFRTNLKGVFAGGDCVTGPATIIEALNAGNRVARSIDCYIQGRKFDAEIALRDLVPKKGRESLYIPARLGEKVKHLDPKERVAGFNEIEGGFNAAEAIEEAKRCLRCYRVVVWDRT